MKKLLTAAMSIVALCTAANANMLLNPGFEQGDNQQVGSGEITNWATWGGSGWHISDEGRVIDTKAVKLWWDWTGLYQDVTISGGDELTYGIHVMLPADNPASWNGYCKIEFYNSSDTGNKLAQEEIKFTSADNAHDEWIKIQDTVTAPQNADIARVVFELRDWFDGVSGDMIIDNAFLTVPEPASLALMGLGGLALLRRRK